MCQKELV
jgi:hypothetical protein